MTETLGLQIKNDPPKEFIRGQTLEFLMDLPPEIPAGYFVGTGLVTTLLAKLHKAEDASDAGLITELVVTFEEGSEGTQLRFKTAADVITDDWPIGLVEFDVLFTRVKDGTETKKVRSLPVRFVIKDGISK